MPAVFRACGAVGLGVLGVGAGSVPAAGLGDREGRRLQAPALAAVAASCGRCALWPALLDRGAVPARAAGGAAADPLVPQPEPGRPSGDRLPGRVGAASTAWASTWMPAAAQPWVWALAGWLVIGWLLAAVIARR